MATVNYEEKQKANNGYPELAERAQDPPLSSQNMIVQGEPVVYQGQPPLVNQPYAPPTYQSTTVVAVNGPPTYQGAVVFAYCPICKQKTDTQKIAKNGGLVWIMVLVFCLFTCCLFFIPFLVDSWKDQEHQCTKCGNVKGVQKARLF